MFRNVAARSIPLQFHTGRNASVRMNAVAPAAAWHTHIDAIILCSLSERMEWRDRPAACRLDCRQTRNPGHR